MHKRLLVLSFDVFIHDVQGGPLSLIFVWSNSSCIKYTTFLKKIKSLIKNFVFIHLYENSVNPL